MSNEQLDRIEKMLLAQLKSTGHVWWISGYVYGMTSNEDLFIILYPAAENLKEKVVRVYDQDFKKLPRFIPTEGIAGGDTDANPNKEQARKKGIYHESPAFEIVTYDGKDTQMGKERRFGDVLRISRAGQEAIQKMSNNKSQVTDRDQPQPPPLSDMEHLHAVAQGQLPGTINLTEYRSMALKAKTATEFDYAAFMTLNNRMYIDQERIAKTREVIIPGWKPGERANAAMLAALEVYREKRLTAEAKGEAPGPAHALAKKEAMGAYNKAIGNK